MSKRIYIVDHIGNHSGMHYYNQSFKEQLLRLKDVDVKILSNYPDKDSAFYVNIYSGGKLLSIFKLVYNYFKLLLKVLTSQDESFILLSYGTVIDALFMTVSMFSSKIIIDVHEVYALQLKNENIKSIIQHLYSKNIKLVIYHSIRSEQLLDELGYVDKKTFVPHFRFNFQKHYNIKNVGNDIISTVAKGKIKILFFGYLNYEKGIDVLLDAVNTLPGGYSQKLDVIVAGKDIDGTIKQYEENRGFPVTRILRHINDDELVYLFSTTQYVILPYRKTSQSGISEMAFYFKKPILASSLPYFVKMLEDYPSFGVEIGNDYNSTAASIKAVVNSHEKNHNKYFSDDDYMKYLDDHKVLQFLDFMQNYLNPTS